MKIFKLVFLVLFIQACAKAPNRNDSTPAQAAPQNDPKVSPTPTPTTRLDPVPTTEPFSYNFNDTENSCTTGSRRFDTLRLMCINILDADSNNNCASEKRIEKFLNDCQSTGISAYESTLCKINILKPDADVANFIDFNPKDSLKEFKYCVGHTADDVTIGLLDLGGPLYDNLSASIEMVFTETLYGLPKARIKIWNTDTKAQVKFGDGLLKDAFEYRSGGRIALIGTDDGKYKLHVSCASTALCKY